MSKDRPFTESEERRIHALNLAVATLDRAVLLRDVKPEEISRRVIVDAVAYERYLEGGVVPDKLPATTEANDDAR